MKQYLFLCLNFHRILLDLDHQLLRFSRCLDQLRLHVLQFQLHDGYLRCGKVQLLQSSQVSVLHQLDLISLLIQQLLEGKDQLQVGGRRDVVPSTQDIVELGRHEADAFVEVLAHCNGLLTNFVVQVDLLQEFVGHHLQSILWPSLSWNRSR